MLKSTNNPMATYDMFEDAFNFFNERLFNNSLSPCLIILHRHRSAYGYFCADRMAAAKDTGKTAPTKVHEIALNPQHIRTRKPRETFATLVHEMAHQRQQEYGKPPKGAYHNKQWAAMMKEVGLYPSDTAAPGGAETGRYVSHYIVKGGPFDVACDEFMQGRNLSLFGDLPSGVKEKAKTSKHKFECPKCDGVVCWGKATLKVTCGECGHEMELAE